jgi:hypothetical protein
MLLRAAFAAIHTTNATPLQALVDRAVQPRYAAPLRAEITAAAAAAAIAVASTHDGDYSDSYSDNDSGGGSDSGGDGGNSVSDGGGIAKAHASANASGLAPPLCLSGLATRTGIVRLAQLGSFLNELQRINSCTCRRTGVAWRPPATCACTTACGCQRAHSLVL